MLHYAEDWNRYRRNAQRAPLLSAEHERELLLAAQRGAQRAAAELISSHMRLVVDVASHHARPGLDASDLIGEGVLGLLEAVRRFDISHQTRFSSYAVWWVRAFVRKFALANRRIVGMPATRGARLVRSGLRTVEHMLVQELQRHPSHAELAQAMGVKEHDVQVVDQALSSRDVSLSDEVEPLDDSPSPEHLLADAELSMLRMRSMQRALGTLSQRERELVCERLCADDGKSLTELGSDYGVSRQRAGQILEAARQKLRYRLEQVA